MELASSLCSPSARMQLYVQQSIHQPHKEHPEEPALLVRGPWGPLQPEPDGGRVASRTGPTIPTNQSVTSTSTHPTTREEWRPPAGSEQVVGIVASYGKGALLAKIDIESAYCLILVHPPLRAMKWNGSIYVNLVCDRKT